MKLDDWDGRLIIRLDPSDILVSSNGDSFVEIPLICERAYSRVFDGCSASTVIFPENKFNITGEIDSSNNIRNFNVPKNNASFSSINYFIKHLTGIKRINFDKQLESVTGQVNYLELLALLESRKDMFNLCKAYQGLSWLEEIEREVSKKIEEGKKALIPSVEEVRTLEVIDKLKKVISEGTIWNKEYSYEDFSIELDDNGNFRIIYVKNGDTYRIKIDNPSAFYNYSVALNKEASADLNFLFDNIEIVKKVINQAFSKYDSLIAVSKEEQKRKEYLIKFLKNPIVKQALRIRDSGLSYDSLEALSLKPVVDKEFFLANYDLLNAYGLIPFIDLGEVDLSKSNLEGLNLSNSNIRLNLQEYASTGYTLKNTNLENVFLLRQELNGILADGANFKGTQIFITPSRDRIDGAIFDESCLFFREDGTGIPHSDLRRVGINIEQNKKKSLELKV